MFERFSRSWSLTKASWQVLKQDRQLLVFPLVSGLVALGLGLAFVLGMLGLWSIDGLQELAHNHGRNMPPGVFVGIFLAYVAQYFIVFFCNTALVGAVLMRFDGGTPTVADGWRIARSRAMSLLGYAIIAATVGMVLRAIQERVGFLGRIVVGLLGVGWTAATAMVVPILAQRDVGPIEAVEQSAGMLKKTWGENVIGQGGMSVVFGLLVFALIGSTAVLTAIAFVGLGSVVLAALVVFAGFCALMALMLAQAALHGIYAAVLYRYATTGKTGGGFDANVLQAAFARKR